MTELAQKSQQQLDDERGITVGPGERGTYSRIFSRVYRDKVVELGDSDAARVATQEAVEAVKVRRVNAEDAKRA